MVSISALNSANLEQLVQGLSADDSARVFVSCGNVIPDHVIELRDEDGTVLGQRQVGRVYAKGPSIMQGYFNDPAATEEALVDGWLDTGDLGYWVGEPFARHGHTLAAVRVVVEFSFRRLGLHRLEAACVPPNVASQGVLTKAGFAQEGRAEAYLKIDGVWRDHLLFGRLSGPTGLGR